MQRDVRLKLDLYSIETTLSTGHSVGQFSYDRVFCVSSFHISSVWIDLAPSQGEIINTSAVSLSQSSGAAGANLCIRGWMIRLHLQRVKNISLEKCCEIMGTVMV